MRRIKKLGRDQIKSALFELRFDPIHDGLADLLPGMLYGSLGAAYPTVSALPPSEMPLAIRQQMPNWQFMGLRQMSSADSRSNLNIASSSVYLELIGGYPGWDEFRSQIHAIVDAIAKLGVVSRFTRYSLRYQNILPADVLPDLSELQFSLTMAGKEVSKSGIQVRAELHEEDIVAVVNLMPSIVFNVSMKGQNFEESGALVDIDVVPTHMPEDFLSRKVLLIDQLHEREKEVFFGILSESVINRLEPVWED